uniref:DUF4346 domain-containing protein n=1 Tax=Campylaephora sungminbooi TaxID=1896769 RepID=A0A1B0TIF0_9FLOR|nr:hypothetical protein BI106_gp038 [Campylaephora sungminbooi]AKU47489.1 hypothetical protein [Campylaephora sungminbooi]ALN11936.1 hypothetical protein 121 [Campylaephora sungminbooi]
MDSFYCLVRIILNKKLSLYCFNCIVPKDPSQKVLNLVHPICFTAKSSGNIIKLLSLHSCFNVIAVNHISYLAIELYKAELSLVLGQIYIQN